MLISSFLGLIQLVFDVHLEVLLAHEFDVLYVFHGQNVILCLLFDGFKFIVSELPGMLYLVVQIFPLFGQHLLLEMLDIPLSLSDFFELLLFIFNDLCSQLFGLLLSLKMFLHQFRRTTKSLLWILVLSKEASMNSVDSVFFNF